ncbi:NUDIX domain-containing protein [Microlunatus elymi]|uniref:NUDIX domain-containing protein n=1 Tax=Microlunatus elymi TaxID=2596828 RepID=A0A516Q3V0_9ACTN|nr:NUDIX domain-containing protein [Microlunatus elymi]QDP98110.1 NUDIX domain-containing protein [Microlunatus elymi]
MSTPPRNFVIPDDPADRLRRRRTAARVIVVDPNDRILLFCDTDPGCPGQRWWVTPGGGIDPGETEREAAVRELAEENGLRIAETELIGPVARRRVQHGYSDQVLDQDEVFFVLRTAAFELDSSGFTEEEKITLVEHRWWSPRELSETTEWIWPQQLRQLLALADEGPGVPVDLGLVTDESTRPV